MAWIDLEGRREARTLPLAASTVIGRSAACTFVVDDARVPNLWVELRWFPDGEAWGWRPLREPDPTDGRRGAAKGLPAGWHPLRPGQELSLPGVVVLRLRDAGAPERFAVDQRSGEVLRGAALAALVVDLANGPWPADAESQAEPVGPIPDGGVFEAGGRLLRLSEAVPPPRTDHGGVDLREAACELTLVRRGAEWTLLVTQGKAEVELRERPVRVLVPYVEARLREGDSGGWLARIDAHERWLELGGDPRSPEERVSVDRARLLERLAERGVQGTQALFDAPERRLGRYYMRCAVPRERLGLVP